MVFLLLVNSKTLFELISESHSGQVTSKGSNPTLFTLTTQEYPQFEQVISYLVTFIFVFNKLFNFFFDKPPL